MSLEVSQEITTTTTTNRTNVDTNEVISNVSTTHNKLAEVSTNTYILQSLAGAEFSDANGLPAWLGRAIDDAVVDGTVDIQQLTTDLQTAFNILDTGVNQQISSIQTDVLSTNTKLDSNISRLDGDVAGVLSLTNTKVTEAEATASAITAVTSAFNTPGTAANSMVVDLITTHADPSGTSATKVDELLSAFNSINADTNAAIDVEASNTNTRLTNAGLDTNGNLIAGATTLGVLSAKIDDTEVRLQTEEAVSVGTHVWDGTETLLIGMKSSTTSPISTYMGGILGWVLDTKLDASDAQSTANTAKEGASAAQSTANTAKAWAAGASSLVIDENTGAMTGWNYASGSTGQSTFAINANSFYIANSTTNKKPFEINGSKIKMTADVEIDGGLTVGTIKSGAKTLNGSHSITEFDVDTGLITVRDYNDVIRVQLGMLS